MRFGSVDDWIEWSFQIFIGIIIGVLIGVFSSSGKQPESLVSDDDLGVFLFGSASFSCGLVSFLARMRTEGFDRSFNLPWLISPFLILTGVVAIAIALSSE